MPGMQAISILVGNLPVELDISTIFLTVCALVPGLWFGALCQAYLVSLIGPSPLSRRALRAVSSR